MCELTSRQDYVPQSDHDRWGPKESNCVQNPLGRKIFSWGKNHEKKGNCEKDALNCCPNFHEARPCSLRLFPIDKRNHYLNVSSAIFQIATLLWLILHGYGFFWQEIKQSFFGSPRKSNPILTTTKCQFLLLIFSELLFSGKKFLQWRNALHKKSQKHFKPKMGAFELLKIVPVSWQDSNKIRAPVEQWE